MVARLRHHARTGDSAIFSRDAMPIAGPSSNLRFQDEDPLRVASRFNSPNTLPLPRVNHATAGGSSTLSTSTRSRRGGNTDGPGLAARRGRATPEHQAIDVQGLLDGMFGGQRPAAPPPRPRGGRAQQGGRFNGVFPPGHRNNFDDNDDDDWFDRDYDPQEPDVDHEENRPRGALYEELLNAEIERNARNARNVEQIRQMREQGQWFGGLGGPFANLRRALGLQNGRWPFGVGGTGGGGGGAGYAQAAPAIPPGWQMGPGGTFSVKRKVKNYSVRASHPKFDKRKCKGFERDIVPPPEPTEEEEKENLPTPPAVVPVKQNIKGKGRAKAENIDSDIEQVPYKTEDADVLPVSLEASVAAAPVRKMRKIRAPVCASCLSPLYLNQPAKNRPHLLICGHVVCAPCIRAAKDRVDAWYEAKNTISIDDDDDDEDEVASGTDIPVPGHWIGSDLHETFEVVERQSDGSARVGSKRKRSAPNGRLPAIAPVHDRNRRARTAAIGSGSGRSTHASAMTGSNTRGRDKGKGKALHADDEEWRPDAGEDESGAGTSTSTSTATDENEPLRKKVKVTADDHAATQRNRPRRAGADRPNMREGPIDGEVEEDMMNDGPRQPGAGVSSASSSAAVQNRPSHLSIPLAGAALVAETSAACGQSKAKKGKQKAIADDPNVDADGVARIDKDWLACPVVGCLGDTDLQSDIGSKKGAWEIFV